MFNATFDNELLLTDGQCLTPDHPAMFRIGQPRGEDLSTERPIPTCWVISDGAAGNEHQCLALARALGLEPRILRLRIAGPWSWLSPRLTWLAGSAMRLESSEPIRTPWPDIAIGCGRTAALLTRCLRKWSDGRCFTVQILDPRVSPGWFGAVIAPRHDQLTGDNVISTLGALNAIDDAWLEQARQRFPTLEALPAPRTAVLIGGPHKSQPLDATYLDSLLRSLGSLHAQSGGSFLVSTSRRTPVEMRIALREWFTRWPGVFWADRSDGENSYPGMLGWADRFVVSADSVNMISEACATGKPVHAFAASPMTGKLAMFHETLRNEGHLTALDANASPAGKPLRELNDVRQRVWELWQATGNTHVEHPGSGESPDPS